MTSTTNVDENPANNLPVASSLSAVASVAFFALASRKCRGREERATRNAVLCALVGGILVISAPLVDATVNLPRPHGGPGEAAGGTAAANATAGGVSVTVRSAPPLSAAPVVYEPPDIQVRSPVTIPLTMPEVNVPVTMPPVQVPVTVQQPPPPPPPPSTATASDQVGELLQKLPLEKQGVEAESEDGNGVVSEGGGEAVMHPTMVHALERQLVDEAASALDRGADATRRSDGGLSLRICALILTVVATSWLAAIARRQRDLAEHYENAVLTLRTARLGGQAIDVARFASLPRSDDATSLLDTLGKTISLRQP